MLLLYVRAEWEKAGMQKSLPAIYRRTALPSWGHLNVGDLIPLDHSNCSAA